MECLGKYTFLVMTSVILSCGLKMRDEHGKVREVFISGHDFCHTFRWYGNEGRERNAWGGIYFVMTSVIASGGVKRRDEHGMLRRVYIFVMTSVIRSGGMKNEGGIHLLPYFQVV